MNHFTHGVVRALAESFELPEPILEVGSFQVEGQEEVSNPRSLFPGREYLGIDVRPGPGVDLIANVEDLPFPAASVGTVLALNTFEHVPHFWRGLDEIYRVLRPDGVLLVSVPFYFHIHAYPNDYWRFTPAALDVVLDTYPTRLIGYHGPKRRPLGVWAVAFREEARPTAAAIQRYEQALKEHAREPLGWRNWLRYSLGRCLFGSRPFSPYLERDRWSLEVHHNKSASGGRKAEARDQKSEVSKENEPASDLRPLTSDF
ncbi:MAG TPA: class I SAM-dependent methyltransferase [Gemmataceae bacterium]|jgi:SAM-dependent methyltransferase|nr:class I SAM-dependent methyltransferase [Gemmataceae bacterium]